jgi:GntR family transcriptional regulator
MMVKRKMPKYQVIAAELQKLIKYRKIGPGEKLPTEAALAERFNVTRPTVREAYRVLIEGREVTLVGKSGYFVRGAKARFWYLSRRGAPVDPWVEMRSQTTERPSQEVSIELLSGDHMLQGKPLQEWFADSEAGDEFLCRRQLRGLDGEPVQLAATYMPLHVAQDTPLRRAVPTEASSISLLTDSRHVKLGNVTDVSSGRTATELESKSLGLAERAPGVELVRQFRIGLDGSVLAVESLVMDAHEARVVHESLEH